MNLKSGLVGTSGTMGEPAWLTCAFNNRLVVPTMGSPRVWGITITGADQN